MKYRRRKVKSYVPYPPEFNEDFKRYIRKRDGLLCSICAKRSRLDVHHIDYNKLNTTKTNCISLCRDCHEIIHRSSWVIKQDWKYKLWKIAAERERRQYESQRNRGR